MSEPTTTRPSGLNNQERLIAILAPMIGPLGYDLVHLEIVSGRQKTLRLFIDRLEGEPGGAIGIEDCARVSRALDEPLEQLPELNQVFGAAGYELEVSSPGVDRPLRQPRDYERFAGREARIHVYRPLSAEELGNEEYQRKNPRQKNFLGVLKGVSLEKVRLALSSSGDAGRDRKKTARKPGKGGQETARAEQEIQIPLALISKANLEPDFDILEKEKE